MNILTHFRRELVLTKTNGRNIRALYSVTFGNYLKMIYKDIEIFGLWYSWNVMSLKMFGIQNYGTLKNKEMSRNYMIKMIKERVGKP